MQRNNSHISLDELSRHPKSGDGSQIRTPPRDEIRLHLIVFVRECLTGVLCGKQSFGVSGSSRLPVNFFGKSLENWKCATNEGNCHMLSSDPC